jgi:pilus assembly protein TadC
VTAAIAAAGAAAAVWWAFPRAPVLPTRDVGDQPTTGERGRRSSWVEDSRRRTPLCLLACTTVGLVMLGGLGALVGCVAGLGVCGLVGRLEPPSAVREREELARDLPLAVDLLAACSEAGLPTWTALPAVGRAVGGALEKRFASMRARSALGSTPIEEWQRLGSDPTLRRLGAAMVRAHRSGAPVASTLDRLATDVRRDRRTDAQAAARSVGVKVAAPLAACFLPAFMLIGVVPTIVGGFTHLGI